MGGIDSAGTSSALSMVSVERAERRCLGPASILSASSRLTMGGVQRNSVSSIESEAAVVKIVASALTFGSGGPGGRTPRPPVRRRGVASGIVVPGPRWRHRCRVPGPEGHIAARERHWTDGQRCRHRPSESHFNVTHSSHRIPRWDNEGTGLERHLRCTRTTNLSIGGTNTPIDSGKRFEISSAGQVPPKVFVTVQVFSGTRPTSDKRRAAVRSPGQL